MDYRNKRILILKCNETLTAMLLFIKCIRTSSVSLYLIVQNFSHYQVSNRAILALSLTHFNFCYLSLRRLINLLSRSIVFKLLDEIVKAEVDCNDESDFAGDGLAGGVCDTERRGRRGGKGGGSENLLKN